MIENSRIDPTRVQQEREEGHKAGIAFATYDPGDGDLLVLRKFLELPCDSDFAAELFSHYPDLSYGEFADHLLAMRRPSHPTISFWRSPRRRSRCWRKSKGANEREEQGYEHKHHAQRIPTQDDRRRQPTSRGDARHD